MISSPLPGIPGKDFRIVQTFYDNPNRHYTKLYGMKGHGGYDLAPMTPGQRGVIVYAPHDGILEQINAGAVGLGRHVTLTDRELGRLTYLGHFERYVASAKNGQLVHEHDPVGIMGETGDATGVHVHFEFKHIRPQDGAVIDAGNGFRGAVPIGYLTSLWLPQTLTAEGA